MSSDNHDLNDMKCKMKSCGRYNENGAYNCTKTDKMWCYYYNEIADHLFADRTKAIMEEVEEAMKTECTKWQSCLNGPCRGYIETLSVPIHKIDCPLAGIRQAYEKGERHEG